MKQQTAVEFLLSELDIAKLIEREKLTMVAEVVRQAKEMEMLQIITAHNYAELCPSKNVSLDYKNGLDYYNSLYKDENV
jgi:hypothetical protein